MASLFLYNNALLFCGFCGDGPTDYGGAFAIDVNCCCDVGGLYVGVGCCENPLSRRMLFRFKDCTGAAACLNGMEFEMEYDDINDRWDAIDPVGCDDNGFSAFALQCVCLLEVCTIFTWQVFLAGCVNELTSPGGSGGPDQGSVECDPFHVEGLFVTTANGTCADLGDTIGYEIDEIF